MRAVLLPCPFCGCSTIRTFTVFGSGRYRVDCNACNCGAEHPDEAKALAMWNCRSDRAGILAGLREADELCAERPGGRAISTSIRARIAEIEGEDKTT